jgi:hypothetical protein
MYMYMHMVVSGQFYNQNEYTHADGTSDAIVSMQHQEDAASRISFTL